ncbi:hypothetical protein [Streptomonospora salina]|uniref:Uncharacterized protein n=1 Tax=Streptomonospora salina TaxID=104205 RepID=A0A841EBG6_9ACTN|nr:hypothetical protein [Streptomonospora salina]MBB5999774.1 hypothetical protein [Streptomonospora salina]
MRKLSRTVRDRLGRLTEPHRGARAADRVRPYVIRSAAADTRPPVPPAETGRIVGPWYERWEQQTVPTAGRDDLIWCASCFNWHRTGDCPEKKPAGDTLDDVRQALAGPIRALAAARPDLTSPAPAEGRVREPAGVR